MTLPLRWPLDATRPLAPLRSTGRNAPASHPSSTNAARPAAPPAAAPTPSLPERRRVEKQLGRPVIKAFNNIYVKHSLEPGQAPVLPNRNALPVASDDPRAKRVVMELVGRGADNSWRQPPERRSAPPIAMPKGSAMLSQPPIASAPWGRPLLHHPTKHFISGSNGARMSYSLDRGNGRNIRRHFQTFRRSLDIGLDF